MSTIWAIGYEQTARAALIAVLQSAQVELPEAMAAMAHLRELAQERRTACLTSQWWISNPETAQTLSSRGAANSLNSTKAASPTAANPTCRTQNAAVSMSEYHPPTTPTILFAAKNAR